VWKGGVVRYDIEVLYPQGWLLIGSVPGNVTTFLDVNVPRNDIKGGYVYRVTAIENSATPALAKSNQSDIYYPSKIIVPTAFTPNNDGLNDSLYVVGGGVKQYSFKVFDRWGKCVFEADDITKGWNGFDKQTNEPCVVGVYTYTLIAKGLDYKRYTDRGTITLLK
jgi:gliding motility-associated-like protein